MRGVICAVAVVGLLLGGCTTPEPTAAPPTQPPPSTLSPTPEPPPVAPLTGEQLDEAIARPVLAVKIDNASAALPPAGLEFADIVFEEEVEGGLTRLLALFHSRVPGDLGPVRSGREADADLLPPFGAVFALSGAAAVVDELFAKAGLNVVEDDDMMEAFSRAPDRVVPHDLMMRTAPVLEAGDPDDAPDEPVFSFDKRTPAGGDKATSAHLVFSPFANATWTWEKRRWSRQQNNSDHATAKGRTIGADNVVIVRVVTSKGGRTDSAGTPTVDIKVVGRGKAVVLRDGKSFDVRWRKRSPEDHIELLDADVEPFPLRPGQTWVELLPAGAPLDIRGGSGTSGG